MAASRAFDSAAKQHLRQALMRMSIAVVCAFYRRDAKCLRQQPAQRVVNIPHFPAKKRQPLVLRLKLRAPGFPRCFGGRTGRVLMRVVRMRMRMRVDIPVGFAPTRVRVRVAFAAMFNPVVQCGAESNHAASGYAQGQKCSD